MYKYLYGKKEYLMPLVLGEGKIRFTNIREYAQHENQNIRDDELSKILYLNYNTSREIKFSWKNEERLFTFNPGDRAEFKFIPIICYLKCFTNKAFSSEMYTKFSADICLKIDIEKLEESVHAVFSHNYPNIDYRLCHNNVTYFSRLSDLDKFSGKISTLDFAFLKPSVFSLEEEYRLVLYFSNESLNQFKNIDISVPEKSSEYYYVLDYKCIQKGK